MKVKIDYRPREYFTPFHKMEKQYGVLVCHRRAGKTVAALNQLIKAVLVNPNPNPRGAYVAPTFTQAKDIVWTYLKEYTKNIPGTKYFEYDLRVDFATGGRIKLYGAENVDRLRGLYFDYVIFDEYADMNPSIWEDVVSPSLSDRGGRAVFMGTPKGVDAFHRIWEFAQANSDDWYCLDEQPDHVLKASTTGILSPEVLLKEFKNMGEAKYAREFECDFQATFEGAYYGREIRQAIGENRVGAYNYDPAADVYACWDIGIDDPMAVWTFQCINRSWVWLDYHESSDIGISGFISWIKSLKYKIDLHYLPHDAKARDPSDTKTRQHFMEDRGLKTQIVKKHAPEEGIQAVRLILPRCYFNFAGTQRGVSALRMYRTKFDEKNQTLQIKPLHDWASHGADAFRCGVMGIDEEYLLSYQQSDWNKPINRPWEGSYV